MLAFFTSFYRLASSFCCWFSLNISIFFSYFPLHRPARFFCWLNIIFVARWKIKTAVRSVSEHDRAQPCDGWLDRTATAAKNYSKKKTIKICIESQMRVKWENFLRNCALSSFDEWTDFTSFCGSSRHCAACSHFAKQVLESKNWYECCAKLSAHSFSRWIWL